MAPNLEVSTAEGGLDDTVEDVVELATWVGFLTKSSFFCLIFWVDFLSLGLTTLVLNF